MIRPARVVHRFGFRQWLVGSLFAAFLIALGFFSLAQDRLDISYERRHDSFFLAEELRQSSDDLSRFARSFVTTGDARYRQHYQRVLDIRDGSAPRPPDYDNVYWDLVGTSAELPPAASAPGVALLKLMQDAGFNAREMGFAEAAYEASEALSVVDIAAMQALVESGPATREKSLSMLHDQRYLEAKARVMQPLHRLHELLELRTRKEVSTAAAWAMVLRVSVALLAFALFSVILDTFRLSIRMLGAPLDTLQDAIARIGRGDFSSHLAGPGERAPEGDNLLGWLERTRQALGEAQSARERDESALRAGERHWRAYFDSPLVGMSAISPEGVLVEANSRMLDMGGYRWEDVREGDWQRFSWSENESERLELQRKLLLGEIQNYTRTSWLLRKDGSRLPVRAYASRACREDGSLDYIVLMLSDLSDERAAEFALRASEQRFRTIAEVSADWIWEMDAEGCYTFVSSTVERSLGYRTDEIVGRSSYEFMSPDKAAATEEHFRFVSRTFRNIEHTLFHKDGTPRIFLSSGTPVIDETGRVTGLRGVNQDITARKAIERELEGHRLHLEALVAARTAELEQARDAAEAANRAKSAFLATMSHELRTPMNAILGMTYLLRRDATESQIDRLSKVETAGRHLLGLLNDVLDLSRIEADRLELEETDFSLGSVLDQSRLLMSEAARGKGLELRVENNGVPPWLRGDPTRMRQALLNYVGNAVKFTERGCVTIRASVAEDTQESLLLRFEVEDTGPGIQPEAAQRLFETFVQADASTTRRHGGSGLGLVITRRLARLMGGDAGFDTRPGEGSRFWFTAKVRRGAAPGAVLAMPERRDMLRRLHAGRHILLVEDDPVNREVAEEMLSRSGLVIEVASNGREGVNKVAEAHWDLVLMDINMPEMDGLSATRAIRALPGTADLPIIALTANAFQNDRNACFAAGMNDFIAKPISPAVLQEKLMRWLPEPTAEQRIERSGEEAAAPVAAAQEKASPEVLSALLTELESLLGAGDLASRQLARDNAAVLRSSLGDVAEAVFDAIEHYDYEAAQILLVRARSG